MERSLPALETPHSQLKGRAYLSYQPCSKARPRVLFNRGNISKAGFATLSISFGAGGPELAKVAEAIGGVTVGISSAHR